MSLYGVGLNVTIQKILLDLKLHLTRQGGLGPRNLARVFRNLDKNQNGKLDIKELEAGLAEIGFFPKIVDLQALVKYFDLDGDGNLSHAEFVRALREPLNPRRRKMVEKIFRSLDRDRSGVIEVIDVSTLFFLCGSSTSSQHLRHLKTQRREVRKKDKRGSFGRLLVRLRRSCR
eukprot:TRINITY_DN5019_c0_g2_i7.p1 TRINITY_DN5019_c0_g2~~TRINITY_DN5019_c0_g2_i7.p1  ORF type:complete len:174 (-),score=38.04 TRINITY_DN5019_c0_g2_i7:546-1067(-)